MLLKPFKRVGEPTSFKGIKGPYLFLLMYYVMGGMFSTLIIYIIGFGTIILLSYVSIAIAIIFYKYNDFKKKCKTGDINKMDKDRCRKNLIIKGKIIKRNRI